MISKLPKRKSVQQTSTVSGQREELRQQRNKINELVGVVNLMDDFFMPDRCTCPITFVTDCPVHGFGCPSFPKEPTKTGWEKEFDEAFCICEGNTWIPELDKHGNQVSDILWKPKDIKAFIRQVRQEAVSETIGGIKKEVEKMGENHFETHGELLWTPYDKAISEVIRLFETRLTELKKRG